MKKDSWNYSSFRLGRQTLVNVLFLTASIALGQSAWAQSQTSWNLSGTGTWSTSADWTNGLPTSTTDAVFNASGITAAETFANMSGSFFAQGLIFESTELGVTFSQQTGQTANLFLGTDGIVINTGAGKVTLGMLVNLEGSQTWTLDGSLLTSNSITVDSTVSSPTVLTLQGTSGYDLKSVIADGANSQLSMVYKEGGTLETASTYTGGTTIAAGVITTKNTSGDAFGTGTIFLGDSSADTVAVGIVTDNGLTYANNITLQAGTTGTLSLGGNTNDTPTFSGNVVLNNTLTESTAGGAIFTGVISGTGAIVKNAGLSLVLDNANTYSGGTTLSSGTLDINNSGTSSTNSAIGTGTLTISGGTIDNTSGSAVTLATNNNQVWNGNITFTGSSALNLGTGTVSLGVTGTSAVTRIVTVNSATNALTVGGIISNGTGTGTGNLTKAGVGTLILAGANTYTGTTSVSAGTLDLTGSLAGAVSVSSGAILETTGTGTISGAATLASGSALDFQLDSSTHTANTLTFGTLTFTGSSTTLNISDLGSATLTSGTTFDLANYSTLSGTFSGLSDGSDVTVGSNVFEIQYGTDVTDEITLKDVASVPEPSTWAMLIGGLGLLVFVVRRPSSSKLV